MVGLNVRVSQALCKKWQHPLSVGGASIRIVLFVDKCYTFLLDKENKWDDVYFIILLLAFPQVRILDRIRVRRSHILPSKP